MFIPTFDSTRDHTAKIGRGNKLAKDKLKAIILEVHSFAANIETIITKLRQVYIAKHLFLELLEIRYYNNYSYLLF